MERTMATKQITKPATPETLIASAEMVNLAKEFGQSEKTAESAREHANVIAAKLHKLIPASAVKSLLAEGSAICDGFLAGRFTFKAGKYYGAKGKAQSAGAIRVYLAHFRKAVTTGQAYDENKAKKAGKKTGAKTEKSGDINLKILAKDDKAKAIERLRDFANKLKGSDKFATIAAFLIDALDEAEGK
jgi:hypothetical protein